MAKYMTRKSIATVALSGLIATGIAAMPAQAAAAIVLDSNGESGNFGAVVGQEYTLKANGNVDFLSSNATQLRVEIVNTDGVDATGFKINNTTLTASNHIDRFGFGATDHDLTNTSGDKAVMGFGDGTDSLMTSPFTFSFTGSAEASYEVTVFADSDNDGVRDSDELSSPTRTVSFIPLSKVSASISVTTPVEEDTTIAGSFVFDNIDGSQVAVTDTGVFIESTTDSTIGADASGDANRSLIVPGSTGAAGAAKTTYNSTEDRFEFTTGALDTEDTGLAAALLKSTTLKIHALHDAVGDASAAAGDTMDNTTVVVATRSSGSLEADTVDGSTTATISAATSASAEVKLNSTFGVKAVLKDTASTPAPIAGADVTVKVTTDATLDEDETLTIGGTTYDADSELPGATDVDKLSVVTNADGEAIVTVTAAGLAADDTVTFEFEYENRTATIGATNKASVYKAHLTNAVDTSVTVDGSASVLDFVVTDQFNGTPDNGDYRVYSDFVSGSSSQATTNSTDATESFAEVTNGRSTLSFTDNGEGAGTNVYDVYLGKLDNAGGYSSSVQFLDAYKVQIVSALKVPAAITEATASLADGVYTETLADTNGADDDALNIETQFDDDSRSSVVAPPSLTSGATGVTISGTVTAADGTVIDDQTVTISGPLTMMFKLDVAAVSGDGDSSTGDPDDIVAQAVYSVGDITVTTDDNGAYSVTAFSNAAGKQTVTMTAGSVSQTLILDSFQSAADDTGEVLTLNAPDSILPGRTLTVTGSLTDKFGNPVTADGTGEDFVLSWDGPGYKNSAPTEIRADGTFTWSILLGANDSGTGTFTAAYDLNENGDYTDTGDILVQKSVTIGSTYGTMSAWTVDQGDGTAKVYVKFPTVGDKVRIGHQTGGSGSYETIYVKTTTSETMDGLNVVPGVGTYVVRTIDLVDGTNRIRVTVGDSTEVQVRYNE